MGYLDKLEKNNYYLIAEIGVNYYDIAEKENISLMEAAKLMVREAHEAEVDAVKFQTYKADTLASKYSPAYWSLSEEPTTSQYELFKKFDKFNKEDYQELSDYCNKIGIDFFSTPFDIDSAEYLNDMMEVYKISSSDISNLPFIRFIAKKNKPIILSTGASDKNEIQDAIDVIREDNDQPITLCHCVLEYPTPAEHANLNKIISLQKDFPDVIVGYSDHTKPDIDVINTAYNLGARVIEKHFTLDKRLTGNDHYHAMDPTDAKQYIKNFRYINKIRGSYELECLSSEQSARKNARRSLVAKNKIEKETIITEQMITFKRPGIGISPSELGNLVGKRVKCDIEADTILQWEFFE